MDRRAFLQMLGLFSSATLLTSCGSEKAQNRLISTLVPPDEGVIPGEARWFATSCGECPAGCGQLVRVREERPVKLEGIPGHPLSDGALCLRGQASLWRLYHPERLKTPLLRQPGGDFAPISWDEALDRWTAALQQARDRGEQSLYLAGRTTGSLSDLIEEFCRATGMERCAEFEYYGHSALRQSYGALFGLPDLPRFRFEEADLLLSLGADLLETFINPVDFARQYAQAVQRPDFTWWHLEPHYSLTGANAHLRLALAPGSEPWLLSWLLRSLAAAGKLVQPLPPELLALVPDPALKEVAVQTGLAEARLSELRDRLAMAQRPLLIAGGIATGHEGGAATAALAALLQWSTGMLEGGVDFSRLEHYRGCGSLTSMQDLSARLAQGRVGALFIARTNPIYHLPAALGFAAGLAQVPFKVGLGEFLDETLAAMDLVLPLSHPLESWGDAEPREGVRTLIKPVVAPLHEGRSEGELLLELLRRSGQEVPESYQAYLFAAWRRRYDAATLERFAADGYLEEPAAGRSLRLNVEGAAALLQDLTLPRALGPAALVIAPSVRRFDGRSRPIPLLAEIPDPLTTVSYGGFVSVGPQTAQARSLAEGDQLRLQLADWALELPVKLQPGLAAGIFLVQRDHLDGPPPGFVGATGEALACLGGLEVVKTGRSLRLPILAGSSSQEGRGVIPDPVHREGKEKHPRVSLYPEHQHPNYRWAMAIDLRLCTGCAACVAACTIENNVPVTGPADHLKGREMSWLRIEPFYDDAGEVEFLPMLCQHCHYAPCEPVCPVYAAYHNPEGLNVQVYNRCVGTRYCSNNCPYKVRRFNWWQHRRQPPLDRMVNPDLSVRSRGMMEKCTFCIQRIRAAGDRAKDEGRSIRDGEVTPACVQTCPTGALVFGNLLDPHSRVAALTKRAQRVFEELGTEPSVYYLPTAGGPGRAGGEHG